MLIESKQEHRDPRLLAAQEREEYFKVFSIWHLFIL